MNSSTGLRALPVAFIVFCVITSAARGVQDRSEAALARDEIGAQIEELDTTLRAAAMSGTLTDGEAKEIFGRVARAMKAAYVRDFGGGKDGPEDAPSAVGNVLRLFAPKPEQMRVLLQPEFLRRDLPLLRDELELDRGQMMIVEVLVDDYAKAYDLASAPLEEALTQYRSATMNSYIAFVLEDADVKLEAAMESVRQVNREEAVARMTESLARIDREKEAGLAEAGQEDRERYEAWKRSMIAATSELDDRLAAIRDRTTARLSVMGRADAPITAEELARMARQLRSDRAQLRTDVTDSIEMIATDEQRGEENALFESAMARVRIGRLMPRGRLGGESMDLRAALTETGRQRSSQPGVIELLEYAEAMLREQAPGIAARLDERTEATIDRELAGLDLRIERDRIAAANGESIFDVDERRMADAVRPYSEALRREVSASVAVRNALLTLLDESSACIDEVSPHAELSPLYRDAALRRGFPVEMRRRWAERAIAAAVELEDLADEAREALLTLESETVSDLRTLRNNAIAERIRRDPKLARTLVDARLQDQKAAIGREVWLEVEHAAFAAIDERTESRLRGILRPDQIESLPARERGKGWGSEIGEGKGKDKSGTTVGKSGGK